MIQVSRDELVALYGALRDGLDAIVEQAALVRRNLPSGEVKTAIDVIHCTAADLAAKLRGTAF